MKPSEMGLHSRVRFVIRLSSNNRMIQKNEIIQFATGLYDFIFDFMAQNEHASLEITQQLARFVSKSFTFVGYEDDEIYSILLKAADMKRKPKRRS